MFRFLFLTAIIVVVAGCTHIQEPVVVTPQYVHAYANQCSAAPENNLTPVGYVVAGLDAVDEQCITFFDGIVQLQKDARYASSSVATANAQTAVVLGLVKASAGTIGVIAAGSELARKLIEGYAAEYAFSPYALESRKVVFDAMKAYRDDTNTVTLVNSLQRPSGDNYCAAQNVIRNYAKICSIGGIEALTRQAIANTKINKSDAGPQNPGGSSLRPASGGRVHSLVPARTPARIGLGLPNFVAGN